MRKLFQVKITEAILYIFKSSIFWEFSRKIQYFYHSIKYEKTKSSYKKHI